MLGSIWRRAVVGKVIPERKAVNLFRRRDIKRMAGCPSLQKDALAKESAV
jgi:hypothetical protein